MYMLFSFAYFEFINSTKWLISRQFSNLDQINLMARVIICIHYHPHSLRFKQQLSGQTSRLHSLPATVATAATADTHNNLTQQSYPPPSYGLYKKNRDYKRVIGNKFKCTCVFATEPCNPFQMLCPAFYASVGRQQKKSDVKTVNADGAMNDNEEERCARK